MKAKNANTKNPNIEQRFIRDRTDLFGLPFFSFIFKNKTFLFILRTLVLLLMVYAIVDGFLYQGSENIFTTGVFWGLFWSLFMIASLSTLGRVFCGICPHAFIGKYITSRGFKLQLPDFLKNPYIGMFLLVFGWWGIFYADERFFRTPYMTAVFFTGMSILAVIFFGLFEGMSYCKYLCPIGTVTRAFAKISFTWLGTYQEKCKTCRQFDCAKACPYGLKPYSFDRKLTMSDCTLCMDCSAACEAVSFKLKPPSFSLFKAFKPFGSEVWAYLLIISAISVAMVYHHALGRSAIVNRLPWSRTAVWFNSLFDQIHLDFTGVIVFVYALFSVVGIAVIGIYLAAKILKTEFKTTFYTLGYAFAPIFIIGGLSHLLEMFFYQTFSTIANGFIQGFGLNIDHVLPLAKRGAGWLRIFAIIPYISIIWAFVIMAKRMTFLSNRRWKRWLAFPFASALIIFYTFLNIYVVYVFATYGAAPRSSHQHGVMSQDRFQQVTQEQVILLQVGEDRQQCQMCGMNLTGFFKTNHAITLKDGTVKQYCSIHCLIDDMAKHQYQNEYLNHDAIQVVDTQRLTFIGAKSAFYVIDSQIGGTMTINSKYAFFDKNEAIKFAEQYHGKVIDFKTALSVGSSDFQQP